MGQATFRDAQGRFRWGNSDPTKKRGLNDPPTNNNNTHHNSGYKNYDYQFETEPVEKTSFSLAEVFGIPRPLLSEGNDSSKMFLYYKFGNICWLLVILIVFISMMVTISLVDKDLTTSWNSQGSRRLNDRNVPISSISSASVIPTLTKNKQPTFIHHIKNSTSSTSAIWGGKVFFTTWDGKIIALNQKTYKLIWEMDICVGVYGLNPTVCSTALSKALYISTATPTIWGNKLVISIKQPADIVVLSQETGQIVKKLNLDANPLAEVTQSGTVVNNALYIGTSIAKENLAKDKSTTQPNGGMCGFLGNFFKIDLNNMVVIWKKSTADPNVVSPSPSNPLSRFSGIPIRGSSPPLSIKEGLIYFTTGDYNCAPSEFTQCILNNTYDKIDEICYNDIRWKNALFNSVVALDAKSGNVVWFERLRGYKTWDVTCGDGLPRISGTCINKNQTCPFKKNKMANCPTTYQSNWQNFEFASDPVLQIHSDGFENVYVAQQNGVIYSLLSQKNKNNNNNKIHRSIKYNSRIIWATHVLQGSGVGGIAVNKAGVFFTLSNDDQDAWYYNNDYHSSYCGGWGALNTDNGLPIWYSPHPLCDARYDYFWAVDEAGSHAPPSVTNDLLLITSSDQPVLYNTTNSFNGTSSIGFGGHVYAVSTKTGKVVESYQTGVPFYNQGLSLHNRCFYVGDGYLEGKKNYIYGSKLYAWCVVPYAQPLCEMSG